MTPITRATGDRWIVYHGSGCEARGSNPDFALVFKFPRGPHDYGRLFVTDAGSHGLNEISQLHVLPGGALSLALLGWGQDASGEIYALGNISGVPFPDPASGPTGLVLKLVPAPEADD
jgi:hypothetical protein